MRRNEVGTNNMQKEDVKAVETRREAVGAVEMCGEETREQEM